MLPIQKNCFHFTERYRLGKTNLLWNDDQKCMQNAVSGYECPLRHENGRNRIIGGRRETG